MALTTLTKEEFQTYSDQVSSRSFMQSVQMGDLLEKRGARIVYLLLNKKEKFKLQLWFIACPCWVVCIWNSIRGQFIPNKMLFQFFMQS
ncbi:peptidoglycan bridge formation glycyltransferase FemA/FemB family protein [Streptococcus pneumoniae]|uniref:peptidoglycan bridge formation glycyltransferase FemA/FemB family protein n=1 Tax=Streptococcus pneumoniae TaxID=1313 RepID=UPI00355B218D